MEVKNIYKVAIYPAIGIARIGNSPEYFLASNIPGKTPQPEGGFKDDDNLFKKQVPLFRIYAFDVNDQPVAEITAPEASIEWRVHVANRKAAWYQFNNALDLGDKSIPSTKRNGGITGIDRDELVIDPGPKRITGNNISGPSYKMEGNFQGKQVLLGEIRTDDKGRLMVFGGDGKSASTDGMPAITFANNDGWHDDISDGTVRATVTINGQSFEAAPAMVICTPPNFGPGLFPVVSMYDVVHDLYIREQWEPAPGRITFYGDVYPILCCMSSTQWVNEGFFMLFGTNSPSDFNNKEYMQILSSPDNAYRSERERVFKWFRDTYSKEYLPSRIPPHYGDLFGDFTDLPQVDLSVTPTQYEILQRWAEGDFITGEIKPDVEFESLSLQEQTDALLKAPLAECLGGPFHPGIEITWPFRHLMMWESPYRLKLLPENTAVKDDYGPMLTTEIALSKGGPLDGSGPGSLTRWLGVPWQTDEASCLSGYDVTLYLPLPSFWSVRVPNTVLSDDSFHRATIPSLNEGQRLKHFAYRVDWLRDFSTSYVPRINNMVKKWHQLGVIAQRNVLTDSPLLPNVWWVETERRGPAGEDPTFKQVLYAEKEVEVEAKEQMKIQGAFVKTAGIPDEGQPRQSRPLQRHEM